MNPDFERYAVRDWHGRPMHITPEIHRIMREMSGCGDTPRKGFRQPQKNRKKGKRRAS